MGITINYLAVIVAAIAGAVINALWYSVILKAQVARVRTADPTIAGRDPAPPMYGLALICQLVMAFVLATLIGLTHISGVLGGMIVAALCWLGFTITSMSVIHTYGYRARTFILIDGAAWLIAALAMGAILGAWQ